MSPREGDRLSKGRESELRKMCKAEGGEELE